MFKSILEEAVGEITEKKSKFICHMYPVETVEEAEEKIIELKKKYHDARHNCFAYRIYKDGIERSSDDGEPSGTAGAPMMNILSGKDLNNVLAVVTRYFGGILLGTGGLVKAYQEALNDALENAQIVDKELGTMGAFEIDYSSLEELKYIASNLGLVIEDAQYEEKVLVTILGDKEKIESLKNLERIKIDHIDYLGEKYYSL